jgi:hypothetical protein
VDTAGFTRGYGVRGSLSVLSAQPGFRLKEQLLPWRKKTRVGGWARRITLDPCYRNALDARALTRVPRYFFHVHDSVDIIDREGTEFPSLEEARGAVELEWPTDEGDRLLGAFLTSLGGDTESQDPFGR